MRMQLNWSARRQSLLQVLNFLGSKVASCVNLSHHALQRGNVVILLCAVTGLCMAADIQCCLDFKGQFSLWGGLFIIHYLRLVHIILSYIYIFIHTHAHT